MAQHHRGEQGVIDLTDERNEVRGRSTGETIDERLVPTSRALLLRGTQGILQEVLEEQDDVQG